MDLDVTAPSRELAATAAQLVRLLPNRPLDPVLGGTVVEAGSGGLTLAGTDRERSIRLATTATVHGDGRALVPVRPLADTLRHLAEPEVRLAVEGSRLAVRTSRARFALPLLDLDRHPGVRECPPLAGTLNASFLAKAATVAAAASRDDALPVFTGVHVQQRADRLALVGTDRFRMAVASLPWHGRTDALDVLVPAGLLAEVAKQASGSGEISVHADADRVGISWSGTEISTTLLDAPFPSESRHLEPDYDGTADVDADELAGAVRRVSPFAGAQGSLRLEVDDAEVRVRASDAQFGEADETVKATVSGDRPVLAFQPRYLSDALHAFAGTTVRLGLRSGTRSSSVITEVGSPAEQDPRPTLHYVLMPKRLPDSSPPT